MYSSGKGVTSLTLGGIVFVFPRSHCRYDIARRRHGIIQLASRF